MERCEGSQFAGEPAYLVTGATSGIGFETAKGIAKQRIPVIGVGRDRDRCTKAVESIQAECNHAGVFFETSDLSVQSEIRALASRIAASGARLRGIIHNAGTFCLTRRITADGIERQFAVNYLSGFLLVRLLRSRLEPGSRVLFVSSGSHLSGRIHWNNLSLRPVYNGLTAYSQSKLAEILFTYELDRRGFSLDTYAVDPGLVNTEIGFKEAGGIGRSVWALRAKKGISAAAAAAPIVELAASGEAKGLSGLYWKEGRPTASSKRSYDRSAAKRLWELSERLCLLPAEGCPS